MATETKIARVAFMDRGAYSAETEYNKWDFVTTVDSTYLYIGETPATGKPVTDTAYWKCIADGKQATEAAGLANNAATAANTAAGLADNARLAIQDDLALKADQADLVQLAGEVSQIEVKDAIQDSKIKDIESVISTMNPNQSAQLSVSGVSPLSLPKNAANGGMSVKLEGLTAENLVVNGDFRNGLNGWDTSSSGNSLENGVLTNTSSGTSLSPYAAKGITGKWAEGHKYYCKCKVRANSNINRMYINTTRGLSSDITIVSIPSPIQGQWYDMSAIYSTSTDAIDTNSGFRIVHQYPSLADSAGGSISIEYAMWINLTKTFGAGNEPTKEQCDLIFSDYFEGVKSFEPTGRIRSVGKNLLDSSRFSTRFNGVTPKPTSFTVSSETIIMNNSTVNGCGLSQKIKLSAGVYRFSVKSIVRDAGTASVHLYFRDANDNNIVNASVENGTITVTEENSRIIDRVILFRGGGVGTKNVTITGLQVERSATATTYEPYRETSLYLTAPELRSNGTVKDEIRKGANGYELVKRVGVGDAKLVTDSFTFSSGSSTGTSIAGKVITAVNATGLTSSSGYTIKNNYLCKVKFEISNYSQGDVEQFFSSDSNSYSQTYNANGIYERYYKPTATTGNVQFRLRNDFTGTLTILEIIDYSSVDGIMAGTSYTLQGSNIHYTLATPEIIPISYGGILNSAENGTIYHEPIIADAGVYDTKMDILLTDYPIASIEEIIKHENGVDTYLDIASAVVASDGLSFTHPDLADGDLVLFTYAFDKESTNGNITATFYDSNVVKIDTVTGKAYKIEDVVTNGVLTRTLTEV